MSVNSLNLISVFVVIFYLQENVSKEILSQIRKQTELMQLLLQNQKQCGMWADPFHQAPPHLPPVPGAQPLFFPGAPFCRLPGVPAVQPMSGQPLGIPGGHCGQPLPSTQPPGVNSGFHLQGVSGVHGVLPLGVPLVPGDQNLGVPVPLHVEVPGGQAFQDAAGQPLFLNNGQFSGVTGSSLTADGYQFNAVPAGTEKLNTSL